MTRASISKSPILTPSPYGTVTISKVLRDQIVPCFEEHGISHLILAQLHLVQEKLPTGVRLSQGDPLGKSVRRHGQFKIIARWPKEEMEALRFPSFLFVYTGEADIPLGDVILHCPAGYGVLIPPGVPLTAGRGPHWLRPHPEDAYSDILWIQIRPFGAECHVCHTRGVSHESGGYGQHFVIASRRLFAFAESLIEEMTRRAQRFEAVGGAYLLALLNLLLRDWDIGSSEPSPTISSEHDIGRNDFSDSEVAVRRAQTYIEDHLGHHLTLQEIAHAAYISRAHLAQIFRDVLGKTVWEYVMQRRLQEAQKMLKETDLYVHDIAYLTGFVRPSHFYARFTAFTGLTPNQFRHYQRKQQEINSDLSSAGNKKNTN